MHARQARSTINTTKMSATSATQLVPLNQTPTTHLFVVFKKYNYSDYISMQAVDVLIAEPISETCTGCGKKRSGDQLSIALRIQGKHQVFCVPQCIPKEEIPSLLTKVLYRQQQQDQDMRTLKRKIGRLEKQNEALEEEISDLEREHKRDQNAFKRIIMLCEKGKQWSAQISAYFRRRIASIAGKALKNTESDDIEKDSTRLDERSDVHAICIGPDGYHFCTICRGLQDSATRDVLDAKCRAQFHDPKIALAPFADKDLLGLEFNQQSIANQTNGLSQSS
jgi:hypothetical protein